MRYYVSFSIGSGGFFGSAHVTTSRPVSSKEDFALLRDQIAQGAEFSSNSVIVLFYKELPPEDTETEGA